MTQALIVVGALWVVFTLVFLRSRSMPKAAGLGAGVAVAVLAVVLGAVALFSGSAPKTLAEAGLQGRKWHTDDGVSRLDDDEKGAAPIRTPGGEQQMTIVNKPEDVAQASAQTAATLATGLKFVDFRTAFDAHARFGGEKPLEDCKNNPAPGDKTFRVFDCRAGAFLVVMGTLDADGRVRDVIVSGRPEGPDEMRYFARVAGYVARVAKGTRGEGRIVMEALASAARTPGKEVTKTEGRISFAAIRDDSGWWFSAEPAKINAPPPQAAK